MKSVLSYASLLLMSAVTYGQASSETCQDEGIGTVLEGTEYVLVWSDEFSVDGAVCSDKWFHQTQFPQGNSWFNGEVQHYTDRLENSYVEDGMLKIVAKKEQFTDQDVTLNYTSARLNSKYAFTGGRVDVRAKLPAGNGTWPAIWTLGRNVDEPGNYWHELYGNVSWPACGEIDIMEHWGNDPDVIHGSIHTPSSFGGTINTGTTLISDVSNTFHVYSIIWDDSQIKFLVDDVTFYTFRPSPRNSDTWPFTAPQFILLNIAMGGIGGPIDSDFTESMMEIDYVRVYEEGNVTGTFDVAQLPVVSGFAKQGVLTVNNIASRIDGRVLVHTLAGREILSQPISLPQHQFNVGRLGLVLVSVLDNDNRVLLSRKIWTGN